MRDEIIGTVVIGSILVLLLMTWLFRQPAISVTGLTAVTETKPRFHGIRHTGDGDATVTLSTADGRSASVVMQYGKLFLKPEKPGDPPLAADKIALQPTDDDGKPLTGDALKAWCDKNDVKPGDAVLNVSVTSDYYAADNGSGRWLDFGTFAAYRPRARHTRDDAFEIGFRYSPVRLLYGTVAPDLLVSRDAGGVGVSFYPPPQYCGYYWRHIGLEVGYMASFTGRSPSGPITGLSFTTVP